MERMFIKGAGVTAEYLTAREVEIAECIAWGWAKKEIADELCISVNTVTNISANIYIKLGIGKSGELSSWWFCTRYGISESERPKHKRSLIHGVKSIAFALLLIVGINGFRDNNDVMMRARCGSRYRVSQGRVQRKNDDVNS